MKKYILLLLILSSAGLMAQLAMPSPMNTDGDDYGVSFRRTASGYEFWITTADGMRNPDSRHIRVYNMSPDGLGALKQVDMTGINQQEGGGAKPVRDGVPIFGTCNGDYGVFVSDRLVNKEYWGHELYEMNSKANGWEVSRINLGYKDAWDDTPALSSDGSILFFSSDRKDTRERNRMLTKKWAKIYYSYREPDGSWGPARPLDAVNEYGSSQESPMVGDDGYFYYATNISGDYDIWRAKIGPSGLPINQGVPLPENLFPGVNKAGSDQSESLFSPGGKWFIWVTDDGPRTDKDIYWMQLPQRKKYLDLKTMLRTKDIDEFRGVQADYTRPIQTQVVVRDLLLKKELVFDTDESGQTRIELELPKTKDPGSDYRFRQLIVFPMSTSTSYISSIDTLIVDMTYLGQIKHELFLWDTSSYINPKCEQEFPIYNVPFFVTGYWCPTTIDYRDYTPCASMFVDSSCFEMNCNEVENSLYKYEVKQTRVAPCVKYNEFDEHGVDFARQVDSAVYHLKLSMESAFKIPCVARALRQGKQIRVDIIGSTDPRPLHYDCIYTGPDFEEIEGFVQPNPEIIPFFKHGQKFRSQGYGGKSGGNQLLSDLRAYYTGLMMDSLWTETILNYRNAKYNNQLEVHAYGEGVNTDWKKDYARQRSVRVKISVPSAEDEVYAGVKAEPGSMIVLCDACGDAAISRDFALLEANTPNSNMEIVRHLNQNIINQTTENIDPAILARSKQKSTVVPKTPAMKQDDVPEKKETKPQQAKKEEKKKADIASKPIETKSESKDIASAQQPKHEANATKKTTKTKESAETTNCRYVIQYYSAGTAGSLDGKLAILKANNIANVRIKEEILFGRKKVYRLVSGCYNDVDTAMDALFDQMWIKDKLGMKNNPEIISN